MADFTYLLPYTTNEIVSGIPTPTSKYYYLGPILSGAPVNVGSFTVGLTYQINSLGTTDFTLLAAPGRWVFPDVPKTGDIFIATAAGTLDPNDADAFKVSSFVLPKINTITRDTAGCK